jgi:hypothetical protein
MEKIIMLNQDKISSETLLSNYLKRLFPDDQDALMRLCLSRYNEPFGYHHVDLQTELLGLEHKRIDVDQDIRIGYVFLTSYYYLLDATIDDHLTKEDDRLYLTHLLSAGWRLYLSACEKLAPARCGELCNRFFRYVSENAAGVREELENRSAPLAEEDSYRGSVARSNSFLFLFEMLALLYKVEGVEDLFSALKDLAFHLQRANDLADWREDFRRGRWTPLLRACCRTRGKRLDEQGLEEFMNKSGFLQDRIAETVSALRSVVAAVSYYARGSTGRFMRFCNREIEILERGQEEIK